MISVEELREAAWTLYETADDPKIGAYRRGVLREASDILEDIADDRIAQEARRRAKGTKSDG